MDRCNRIRITKKSNDVENVYDLRSLIKTSQSFMKLNHATKAKEESKPDRGE